MKCARCRTLTESIWIRWSRRSTRRRWRRSGAPPGLGRRNPARPARCGGPARRRASREEPSIGARLSQGYDKIDGMAVHPPAHRRRHRRCGRRPRAQLAGGIRRGSCPRSIWRASTRPTNAERRRSRDGAPRPAHPWWRTTTGRIAGFGSASVRPSARTTTSTGARAGSTPVYVAPEDWGAGHRRAVVPRRRRPACAAAGYLDHAAVGARPRTAAPAGSTSGWAWSPAGATDTYTPPGNTAELPELRYSGPL